MTYKLIRDIDTGDICGVLKDDKFHIPFDKANTDYQEYIAWTKASPKNVAVEAD